MTFNILIILRKCLTCINAAHIEFASCVIEFELCSFQQGCFQRGQFKKHFLRLFLLIFTFVAYLIGIILSNGLQRAEQMLKKMVEWFNFKKGTINLITQKFASSLSFVLKNKTKRNCEKYSQTGITVKIHTNKAGARAKAIMLRSIAARPSRQSPVIAVKQASEITSAA